MPRHINTAKNIKCRQKICLLPTKCILIFLFALAIFLLLTIYNVLLLFSLKNLKI